MSPERRAFSAAFTDFKSGSTNPNPSRCRLSLPATIFFPEATCGIAYLSESS